MGLPFPICSTRLEVADQQLISTSLWFTALEQPMRPAAPSRNQQQPMRIWTGAGWTGLQTSFRHPRVYTADGLPRSSAVHP